MSNGLATMDFFGQQDAARKRSRLLVFLYAFSVLLICSIIGGGVWIVYAMQAGEKAPVHPVLFALVAAIITGLVIGGGSLYRIEQLRGGGSTVASALGGRRISADTTDPDERSHARAVITAIPYTPQSKKVLRSAWIPAPPL